MTTTSSSPSKRLFNVTVLEWRSHTIIIQAENKDQAETLARDAWEKRGDQDEPFDFNESGLDGVIVEES